MPWSVAKQYSVNSIRWACGCSFDDESPPEPKSPNGAEPKSAYLPLPSPKFRQK
ncbi:Uncharacterised protein [Vibrio cholerae]|nr:Uncharacterised protein [Vibrio cholerae]